MSWNSPGGSEKNKNGSEDPSESKDPFRDVPLSARLSGGGGSSTNLGSTLSFREENEHFQDSRAEAKKAHAERMLLLRQVT